MNKKIGLKKTCFSGQRDWRCVQNIYGYNKICLEIQIQRVILLNQVIELSEPSSKKGDHVWMPCVVHITYLMLTEK